LVLVFFEKAAALLFYEKNDCGLNADYLSIMSHLFDLVNINPDQRSLIVFEAACTAVG
jgi:hypothetical protein